MKCFQVSSFSIDCGSDLVPNPVLIQTIEENKITSTPTKPTMKRPTRKRSISSPTMLINVKSSPTKQTKIGPTRKRSISSTTMYINVKSSPTKQTKIRPSQKRSISLPTMHIKSTQTEPTKIKPTAKRSISPPIKHIKIISTPIKHSKVEFTPVTEFKHTGDPTYCHMFQHNLPSLQSLDEPSSSPSEEKGTKLLTLLQAALGTYICYL